MQKVRGVEHVRVSLKDGLTVLDLKPANTIMLEQLRRIIKNNGFVARAATIIARGTVARVNGESAFEVAGTGERYAVDDSAAVTASTIHITGRVDMSKPDKPRLSELVSKPD
jgi:hypothetical protein